MKKTFKVEDYLSVQGLGSPAISPDGDRVAYAVSTLDLEENRQRSAIYLADVAAGSSIKLTLGEKQDHIPRWSPDGERIAFVSNRAERPQIWIIRPDGGEAERLTDAKTGVERFEWSPDGSRIAYLAKDPPPEDEEEKKKRKDDARVVDRDLRTTHLWVIGLRERKARRLTRGRSHVIDLSWSPDGRRIAYAYGPSPSANDLWTSDIAIVPSTGGRRRVLVRRLGFDGAPRWSPDGRWIAFSSQGGMDDPLAPNRLWLVSPRGGEPRELMPREQDFCGGHTWSPDGRFLYYGVGRGTSLQIHRISAVSGRVRVLTSGGDVVSDFGLGASGTTAAWVAQSGRTPPQIHVASVPAMASNQVTDLNAHLGQHRFGRKEVVRWTSDDGTEVEGLLTKPVGYQRGKHYPLLVFVHGGPTGVFLNTYEPAPPGRYPLAVFAERGYAVLQPNPRGSLHYGESFKRANYRDWGGGDYRDIMAGVDALVARGIANPDRLGIMGWSYGGYLTAWTVSQTDRFRAASVGAGIVNLHSMYGTNDIPNYLLAFFGAYPWRDPEEYARHSAITFTDRIRTPVLIQHGEKDERVPFAQAQEFYRSLKDRRIPVEFVAYPRQGHGIGEPRLILDCLKRNLAWFDRWVLGKRPRKLT
ncbi:MAG: S9 family peptidase [Candidatus Latescibacteria bacterium]|jgi:dipeptidyl aminopeptidase/acylaminoacyl peptidase|nr:S9 family peptidase [Candidatus Latescibacterota bacterium]